MKKINYNKDTKEYTVTLKRNEKAILNEMLNIVIETITLKSYNDNAKKKFENEITRRKICDYLIQGFTTSGQPVDVNGLCSLLKIFNRDFRRYSGPEKILRESMNKYYEDNIERIKKNTIWISI